MRGCFNGKVFSVTCFVRYMAEVNYVSMALYTNIVETQLCFSHTFPYGRICTYLFPVRQPCLNASEKTPLFMASTY